MKRPVIIFICLLILVATAALGLLIHMWVKNYRIKTDRDDCIELLRTIDAAKQQWALEHGMDSNAVPTWTDLYPYGGRGGDYYDRWYVHFPPHCPAGGTYIIGRIADAPTCSFPGHKLPEEETLPATRAVAANYISLTQLEFLVGDWRGEVHWKVEQKGLIYTNNVTTSFKWEDGQKFLMRRDHTEYAGSLSDPHWNRGYTNEALVVIYRNIEHVESSYFGHGHGPIHYELVPAGLTNTVQFVNEDNGWVTRETYSLADSTNLTVTFERKDQRTDNFQTSASGLLHKE